MTLEAAIEQLEHAVHQGTGASAGAATVLLFGWNDVHPIRGLLHLDRDNREAALVVIEAALTHRLDGGRVVEDVLGYETLNDFAKDYGINGSAWQR